MESQFKNKSIYHWLVAAASSLIIMVGVGMVINCAGLFYSAVADDLSIRRGDVALYGTICSLMGGFFSPVITKMMEKINFTLMLTTGIVVESLAYGALSFCTQIWMFYILALFIGAGYCMCTSIPLIIVINNWFEKLNGLVTGIVMASTGIGGAIFTQVINLLINNLGWRASYRICAIIALVVSLPGILFIIRLTPTSKGYLPYGAVSSRTSQISVNSSLKQREGKKHNIFSSVLILLILAAVCGACVTAFNSHSAGYAEEIGAGTSLGALMMTGCMIGNIIAKLIFGFLSDRIGPYTTVLIFNVVAAIDLLIIGVTSFRQPAILFTLGFLYGSSFAYCAVALPLVVRKIYGLELYVRVFSLVNMFTNAGFAIFLTVIGYIYDYTGTYRISVFICLTLAILSVVFMFMSASLAKKKFSR